MYNKSSRMGEFHPQALTELYRILSHHTADNVLKEIAAIAFSHVGEVIDWDAEAVSLRPVSKISDRAKKSIKSLHIAELTDGRAVKLVMNDKIRALEMLGKHLGIFDGKGAHNEQGRADVQKRLSERLKIFFEKQKMNEKAKEISP